ncbi:MAG: hypothetical protein JNK67_28485 [Alphaproteobacteria bacterium]|nr:hypothetical protein [Alphaproteobacteria bacterium]
MSRLAAILAAAMLASCGGGDRAVRAPVTLEDTQLASARRVAALAFAQGRFDQAAPLYRAALARAQARDELGAIADLGYDLAVTELRRGDAGASLAAARAARGELERRGAPVFAELQLVEAAALYRGDQRDAAEPLARAVSLGDDAAARRARFLLGLIAADRRDGTALQGAIDALAEAPEPEWRADAAELRGRAAALRGDGAAARASLVAAADLRREVLDYPSMARALAAAAEVAAASGAAAEAADLYLRAGRSLQLATAAGPPAERWLGEAERLARASGRADIVAAVAALRAR